MRTAGLARVVEGYEMLEDGKLAGRFYLDMHPRPGKFKHAAQFASGPAWPAAAPGSGADLQLPRRRHPGIPA